MAGEIRQPIDLAALQKYIEKNVPAIKTPLEVKQVTNKPSSSCHIFQPIDLLWFGIVRLWSIKPYIPAHLAQWPEIRYAQEASRGTSLQDSPPGRAGIPYNTRAGEYGCPGAEGVLFM
jgi:hypothetical protein